MQDLYGTYRGFTFTDESGVALGELCVVLGPGTITQTIATGRGLELDVIDIAEMREMTADEIAAEFDEGADTTGVRGIIHVEATPDTIDEYQHLLFFGAYKGTGEVMENGEIDEDATEQVLVRGMFGEEAFGPSILFTPAQVLAGDFESAVTAIETEARLPGSIPRINNGGRAPRDNPATATSS